MYLRLKMPLMSCERALQTLKFNAKIAIHIAMIESVDMTCLETVNKNNNAQKEKQKTMRLNEINIRDFLSTKLCALVKNCSNLNAIMRIDNV